MRDDFFYKRLNLVVFGNAQIASAHASFFRHQNRIDEHMATDRLA